jgi:hypothetical protein
MPNMTYLCLRNALAGTGISLPPMAPLTVGDLTLTRERGSHLNKPETQTKKGDPINRLAKLDNMEFAYRGADGQNYQVMATRIRTDQVPGAKEFGLSKEYRQFEMHQQNFDPKANKPSDTGTKINPKKTGQVVDAMFRCFAGR